MQLWISCDNVLSLARARHEPKQKPSRLFLYIVSERSFDLSCSHLKQHSHWPSSLCRYRGTGTSLVPGVACGCRGWIDALVGVLGR